MSFRALALLFTLALSAFPAGKGQISGLIFAGDKSPISGARLTAINPENKDSHQAASAANGTYHLTLPEGTYDLTVESPSHLAFQQKVYITPGADNTVNIHLTPSAAPAPRKSVKSKPAKP